MSTHHSDAARPLPDRPNLRHLEKHATKSSSMSLHRSFNLNTCTTLS